MVGRAWGQPRNPSRTVPTRQGDRAEVDLRAGRDSALRRLGRLSYLRRRRVLAAWILLAIGLLALSGAAAGTFEDEFELPGSESQEAVELLEAGGFPTPAGVQGQPVVSPDPGVEDPDDPEIVEPGESVEPLPSMPIAVEKRARPMLSPSKCSPSTLPVAACSEPFSQIQIGHE